LLPHLEDSIVIDRPIDEVWAFLTDWFNMPRMGGSGIIGLRQTSPGPLGVGSTLQGRRTVLGFETRNTYTGTEWDPPHAFAATVEGRPFRSFVSRVTLESTADGTRVVVLADFELQPAMKVLWPFVGPFARRRWHASFARAKGLIEAKPR
jgi:ligand-binding SRPBCC domain-containing protein